MNHQESGKETAVNEPGTIRVTGKGLIRLKPDTVRVTMTLEGMDPDYAETLKRSAADTGKVREAIAPLGFLREDLRTLNFHVEAEYEGYQEEGVYRQRLTGYRFRHELKLEFPLDDERLGQVLAALANAALTPEIGIAYTVKDREAAKNALLGLAVADAKQKASALTGAANVKLGRIRHINYSIGENAFAVQPVLYAGKARKMCADSFSPGIVPEDIEAEDTVAVIWEIE